MPSFCYKVNGLKIHTTGGIDNFLLFIEVGQKADCKSKRIQNYYRTTTQWTKKFNVRIEKIKEEEFC